MLLKREKSLSSSASHITRYFLSADCPWTRCEGAGTTKSLRKENIVAEKSESARKSLFFSCLLREAGNALNQPPAHKEAYYLSAESVSRSLAVNWCYTHSDDSNVRSGYGEVLREGVLKMLFTNYIKN